MTGTVVVLEPGDERAQKIAKAMASQTANDILTLLATGTKSLTDITEQLSIPLTTTKYHTGNLLDAGLITVSDTRYSIKGREVKMYSLTDQLLIVAPKQTNVRALLLKYSSLFAIVIAGTVAVLALAPLLSLQAATGAAPRVGSEAGLYTANAMAGNGVVQELSPGPALAFFLGGVFVIFILLCYEAWLWRKRRSV
ncbi:ArsR/SmtB family transcription factor [Methanoregula sp.]|uniref:ArsR/SmtB family transcription factor n=1 Tax=Methanoregula sp. TaxID=2052170 RepID=UPI003C722199